MNEQLSEILRLLRNLIRIGTVSAVKLDDGLCRVDTGNNTTGWLHWLHWLHWLSARAGKTRSWNTPSVGEQVLVLCLGGELDTGFVLPGNRVTAGWVDGNYLPRGQNENTIGTFVMAWSNTGNVDFNNVVSGGNLFLSTADGSHVGWSLPGSWRCCGAMRTTNDKHRVSLRQRVA